MGRTGIARLLAAVVVLHEKPLLLNPTGFKRREYVTYICEWIRYDGRTLGSLTRVEGW